MSFEKRFYAFLDKLTGIKSDYRSTASDVLEADKYRQTPAIQEMNTEFSALDTKSSALVSHLSLMIAAISILHGTIARGFLRTIFLMEIIFYVCTLVIVIRVIYYVYYSEVAEVVSDENPKLRGIPLMAELNKRMQYYRLAHKMTNIGTIILILSLVFAILFNA